TPDVEELDPALLDTGASGIPKHLDIEFVEHALQVGALQGVVHVRTNAAHAGDGDLMPFTDELLSQAGGHEVGVVVDDHDPLANGLLAFEHLLWSQDMRQRSIGPRDGLLRQVVEANGAPLGTGRDHDPGSAIVEDVVGGHPLLTKRELRALDLLDQLVELHLAVVTMIAPLAETRQGDDIVDVTTNLVTLIDN